MARVAVNKRVIAVMIAVVLAAVATISLLSYVQGVEADAEAKTQPVEVFVAKDVIPAGTAAQAAIGSGLIAKQSVPQSAVLDGSIGSLEQIDGKVATTNILKGEQIVAARFAAQQEDAGFAEIPEDRQAMAVSVELVPGVAGRVNVGDRISLITEIQAEGQTEPQVRYLLQDIEILALGQEVRFVNEEGREGKRLVHPENQVVATLAVTPEEAEQLALAVWQGKIHLTLLPEAQEGQGPVSTPGRTKSSVFN